MANWLWFVAFALVPNVLALVLLTLGLKASEPDSLASLRKRALLCLVVTGVAGGLGLMLGLIQAFGAVGGESVDPSQKARILAEGISESMNSIAFSMLALPLPLVTFVVILLRAKRLAAGGAPGARES